MRIAVPTEVKNNEFRVAITPVGVHELVRRGPEVYIPKGAGVGSSISDEEYVAQGAKIISNAADTWEVGEMVIKVAEQCTASFTPLYDWAWTPEKKIETIASKVYGAKAVDYTAQAKAALKTVYDLGLDKLPVCIAKTQKSLSDNPDLLGRPKDFVVTVRDIEIAAGAEFIIPITGQIMRMPGLPPTPSAEKIDIDNDGNITGLF